MALRPRLPTLVEWVFLIILATPLALAGGWQAFLHYQPDRRAFPVRGIDVSHHQGRIDWPAVAVDDVAFAYLKASEGGDHHDRQFAANWAGARQAGLAVGAYHYFTFCKSGREQAANFIATVPAAGDALPPVVDLEFGGNCGARPDGPALRRELDAFLGPVEFHARRRVVLYMTDEFYRQYGADLPPRALWRRSIVFKPADRPVWTLWQFHNRGTVRGIAGPVDLNLFAGDRAAYGRWARDGA